MVLRNKQNRKNIGVLLLVLIIGVGLGGVFLTEIANIPTDTPADVDYGVLFVAERFVGETDTRWSAWAWDDAGDTSSSELGSWFSSAITANNVAEADIGGKADFQSAKIKGTLWLYVWLDTSATRVLLKAENSTDSFTASDLIMADNAGYQWYGGFNTMEIDDGIYTFTLIAVIGGTSNTLSVFSMQFGDVDISGIVIIGILGVGILIFYLLRKEKKGR